MQAQPAEIQTASLHELKQRAQQLLESQRSLQLQNQALAAERLGFQTERDLLVTQHQELSANCVSLREECASLATHLQELTAQRDSIQQQWEKLQTTVEELQCQLNAHRAKALEQNQEHKLAQQTTEELPVIYAPQSINEEQPVLRAIQEKNRLLQTAIGALPPEARTAFPSSSHAARNSSLLCENPDCPDALISICSTVYSGSTVLGLELESLNSSVRFVGEINRLKVEFNAFRESDDAFRKNLVSQSECSLALGLEVDAFWSERARLSSWESLICSFANIQDHTMSQICVEDSKFSDWVHFFAALVNGKLKLTSHILLILYRDPTEWLCSIKRTNPEADSLDALELYLNEYNSYMNTAIEYSLPIIIVSHERFTRIHQQYSRSIIRAIETRCSRKRGAEALDLQSINAKYPVAIGGNPRAYLSNPFFLASVISNKSSDKITNRSLLAFLNKLNHNDSLSSLSDLQEYTSIVAKNTKATAEIVGSLFLDADTGEKDQRDRAISISSQLEALLREFADNEGFMIENAHAIRAIRSKIWG